MGGYVLIKESKIGGISSKIATLEAFNTKFPQIRYSLPYTKGSTLQVKGTLK